MEQITKNFFDFFSIDSQYETDLKSRSKLKNFIVNDEDENKKEYFLHLNDETLIYLNDYKNMQKTIELFGDKNKLTNLFLISNNKSLVLLFEWGDLMIIPIKYIQTDSFDSHWEKISNTHKIIPTEFETGIFRKHRIVENITRLTVSTSFDADRTKINLTDFLICSRKKFHQEEFSQKMKKNFQIFYKNIFHSYLPVSFKNSTPDLTNTTVIYWVDSSGIVSKDNAEFLIMNVDYYILMIHLTSLECENVIKFNHLTNRLIYIDYKTKFQYIIIQTEFDYYQLSLADKENDFNIRQNIKGGYMPTRLKFSNSSILSVQNYNNDDVICNLCYTNTGIVFEVYFVFELIKPIFIVDFKYFSSRLNLLKDQVINAYLYEKLLLVLIKREDMRYGEIESYNKATDTDKNIDSTFDYSNNCYKILIVNLLMTNLTCIESSDAEKLWCNVSFSLLDSPILSEVVLPFEKILKVSYCETLINFPKQTTKSPSDISEFSSSNQETALLLKKYKDKIKLFSNIKNKSNNINYEPNKKGILYILSEKALHTFNFKSYLFKTENRLNYYKVQLKLGYLLNYDVVRRLELFNLCLGEKLFESMDEIIKEIEQTDYNKSLVLRLLWSNEIKDKINFYDIIEKFFSNFLEIVGEDSAELQLWNILVDYLLSNLLKKFAIVKENFMILLFLHFIKLTKDYKRSREIMGYINLNMMHKILRIINWSKNPESNLNLCNNNNNNNLNLNFLNENQFEEKINFDAKTSQNNLEEKLDISSLDNLDISSSFENKEKNFNIFTRSFSSKNNDVSKSIFSNNFKFIKEQRLDDNIIKLCCSNESSRKISPNYDIFYKMFIYFLFSKKLRKYFEYEVGVMPKLQKNPKENIKSNFSLDEIVLNKIKRFIIFSENNSSLDYELIQIQLLLFSWITDNSNTNEVVIEEILILKLKNLNLSELSLVLNFLVNLFTLNNSQKIINKNEKFIQINIEALLKLTPFTRKENIQLDSENFSSLGEEGIFEFYSSTLKTYFKNFMNFIPHNVKYSLIAKIFELVYFFYFKSLSKIFRMDRINDDKCNSNDTNFDYKETIEDFFRTTGRALANKNSFYNSNSDSIDGKTIQNSHSLIMRFREMSATADKDNKQQMKEMFLNELNKLSSIKDSNSKLNKLIHKQISALNYK